MPALESPDKKIEVTFQRLRVTDHLTQTTHTCPITLPPPKGSLNFPVLHKNFSQQSDSKSLLKLELWFACHFAAWFGILPTFLSHSSEKETK